jgi:hypothetical protein
LGQKVELDWLRTSGERGSISLTSTAMRLPLTTMTPEAIGMLLARILTSSSSVASSSMMAPRPRRSTWCTGIDAVPSTTVMSRETFSRTDTSHDPSFDARAFRRQLSSAIQSHGDG